MKSTYFTIHPGKNPPQNGCRLHIFHILHFPNSTGLFTKPTGHRYTKYWFSLDIDLWLCCVSWCGGYWGVGWTTQERRWSHVLLVCMWRRLHNFVDRGSRRWVVSRFLIIGSAMSKKHEYKCTKSVFYHDGVSSIHYRCFYLKHSVLDVGLLVDFVLKLQVLTYPGPRPQKLHVTSPDNCQRTQRLFMLFIRRCHASFLKLQSGTGCSPKVLCTLKSVPALSVS